jgi:hypothetical protein
VYNIRQLHVSARFLGHHQVVQTSLNSNVHEVKVIYCDDEIAFILQRLVNLLRVKLVRLGVCKSWLWGGGEGWDGVVSDSRMVNVVFLACFVFLFMSMDALFTST